MTGDANRTGDAAYDPATRRRTARRVHEPQRSGNAEAVEALTPAQTATPVIRDVAVSAPGVGTTMAELLNPQQSVRLVILVIPADLEMARRLIGEHAWQLLDADSEAATVAMMLIPDRPVPPAVELSGRPIPSFPEIPHQRSEPLTPREQEVLRLLADGLDVNHIARAIGISLHTSRGHVKRILFKLGAHSQLEAVAKAARLGILDAAADH